MSSKLDCQYLGLTLSSPVVVGACALTLVPESLRQFVYGGAGAVVLPSIFQEQIDDREALRSAPTPGPGPALNQQSYNGGPDRYRTLLQEVKRSVPIPVIASLNGYGPGEWLHFARALADSGADALELNVQPIITSAAQSAAELEALLCEIVGRVTSTVSIPVAVKLSRHYTNPTNMVSRLRQAGAAGVVLFAHEVHWEVATDRLRWTPHWELTPTGSLGPTVAGIIQARAEALPVSIAASGGIRTAEDVVKVMIAGADVAMITSEIYRAGPEVVRRIVQGLQRYFETSGFASVADFQASRPVPQPRSQRALRHDYLDPLTRSDRYHDPTPESTPPTGDRFGHRD